METQMITETPLECLQEAVNEIKDDIAWYAKPNRKGVNLSDAFRAERIAELQAFLAQYEAAISILKENA